jgi:hypothetical protein
MTKLAIVTGPQPDQQVRFAADELKRYVSQAILNENSYRRISSLLKELTET